MSDEIIPEKKPSVMYVDVDEKKYKAELELLDRYQSFSAELLRLSLLGLAIFGFLYQQVFAKPNDTIPIDDVKYWSRLSIISFALAAVFALIYRYCSTEAMRHYLMGLRLSGKSLAEPELKTRFRWLMVCIVCKAASAIFLGLGAALSALALFKLL